jgi:hypothetical protein
MKMQVFPQSMSGNRAKASECCFLRLRYPPEAESFTGTKKKHPDAYNARASHQANHTFLIIIRDSKFFKEAKNGKGKDSHQTQGV